MKLIAVGLIVELHAAFAITRLMASILVGVSTIDFRHLRRHLAALIAVCVRIDTIRDCWTAIQPVYSMVLCFLSCNHSINASAIRYMWEETDATSLSSTEVT